MQVDLHPAAGPCDLVVVGIVEPGRAGPRLEPKAVKDVKRGAALLPGDQKIDVSSGTGARMAIEARVVVEALEHDG